MAAFSWRFSTTSDAMTVAGTQLTALGATNYYPSRESGDDDGLQDRQGPRRQRQPMTRVFRGVVPQPNGRWGAQIYDGHERMWLGTFPDQEAAARAYDVAALRYRGREAATNFPAARWQLAFLAAHSKSEIVDMLRSHTYADELRHGVRRRPGVPAPPAWARVPLFEKALTLSDVGRLNRLVVPRKHAERHLPLQVRASEKGNGGGVFLSFEDGEGKVWRFKYSYWESSQSYVLTRGWISFVREKGLRAGDTVAFSRWTFGPEEQLLIDCRKNSPIVRLFGVDIAV